MIDINYQNHLASIKDAAKAKATKKAIAKNWRGYQAWATDNNLPLLPSNSETVEKYLLFLMFKKKKISTIEQAKWAIDSIHRSNGFNNVLNSENLQTILKGLRRVLGAKKIRKQAFTIEHIAKINFPKTLIGIRDKALLLLGFAGALRRSEIANLNCEDLEWENFGIRLHLKRSKGNQEGKEEFANIMSSKNKAICPVAAIKKWIGISQIYSGALFCSINKAGIPKERISTVSIGKKVKWAAKACGLNEKEFGAHSLRSGCATYLLAKNVPLNIVSKHLRHKKLDTTLQYDRNTTAKNLQGIY